MSQALTPLAVSHAVELRYLAEHPGTGSSQAAGALGRDRSNARRTWQNLEREGLIKDNALTDRGRAALEVMDGAARGPRLGAMIGLTFAQIRIAPTLNPRRVITAEAVEDMANSIEAHGLLQNLVVREVPADWETDPAGVRRANGVRYMLVAGEHRLAAIKRLIDHGKWPLDRLVPCKVIEADDARHTEIALVENLRRKGLEPMEEARAYQKLRDVYQVPTAEIARRIGLTQRLVQQRLQLLELDDAQQTAVAEKRLKVEDARKLVAKSKAPKPAAEATLPEDLANLLRDVARHPGAGLTSYAQTGRWVESSWVARRFDRLFAMGLIDEAREPTITSLGVNVLRRLEGLPPLAPLSLAAELALGRRIAEGPIGDAILATAPGPSPQREAMDVLDAAQAEPYPLAAAVDDEPAEIPDGCALLLEAVLKYPGFGLSEYCRVGIGEPQGIVARRLGLLFDAGLIDARRGPTITPAGRLAVGAHVAVVLERAAAATEPDDLGELTSERLAAARAALAGDGSVIAGIRRVHHDSLWEPAIAVVFLQSVLDVLAAQRAAPRRGARS